MLECFGNSKILIILRDYRLCVHTSKHKFELMLAAIKIGKNVVRNRGVSRNLRKGVWYLPFLLCPLFSLFPLSFPFPSP